MTRVVTIWFGCALALQACVIGPAAEKRPANYRSPIDLAVLPGGRFALTANHTTDSASLIDLTEGKVLAEQACGRKPSGIAVSPNGRQAAVSNLWSGTVTLLEIDEATLKAVGEVAVGPLPRGALIAHDGESLYVATSGADEVVQVDWSSRKVKQRWSAPREPRTIALSADGHKLVVASTRSAQVRCWDTRDGKLLWERQIEDGFNLRGLVFTPMARA